MSLYVISSVLQEHEQALVDAISRIAEVDDGESGKNIFLLDKSNLNFIFCGLPNAIHSRSWTK